MSQVVVLPIALVVMAVSFWGYRVMAVRGREARAANGGRHTTSWWISLTIAVVGLVVIAVVRH